MNVTMTGTADTLDTLLQTRHSCRAFLSAPVPRDTLARAIGMAQRTASWCNAQPWRVHVLSPQATEAARAALLAYIDTHSPHPDLAFPGAYEGVYQERRRTCGWQLYNAVGVAKGDKAGSERQRLENFRFFGAPHVALITADRSLGTYAAVDCGAFVSTFMLAAHALGVATVAQAALAAYSDFWRGHLNLSPDRVVVCGISMGFEDLRHPANGFRTERASQQDVVEWVE